MSIELLTTQAFDNLIDNKADSKTKQKRRIRLSHHQSGTVTWEGGGGIVINPKIVND